MNSPTPPSSHNQRRHRSIPGHFHRVGQHGALPQVGALRKLLGLFERPRLASGVAAQLDRYAAQLTALPESVVIFLGVRPRTVASFLDDAAVPTHKLSDQLGAAASWSALAAVT